MRRRTLRTAAAAALAMVLAIWPAAAHTPVTQVTWARDIAAIVGSHCSGCHTPGGYAPMSLEQYGEARAWGKAMRDEVLAGRMPPWSAARGFADYGNDRSLTPVEVELITSWANGGMPLGNAPASVSPGGATRQVLSRSQPASARQAPARVTVAMPRIPVTEAQVARFVINPSGPTRWISGWRFEPGNRTVVEAARLILEPVGVISQWRPPDGEVLNPAGAMDWMPRGSHLEVEVIYRRPSVRTTDQSSATIIFGRRRPLRQVRHTTVPCGTQAIAEDLDLLSVTPDTRGGDSIEVVGVHADERIEPLCVVPRFERRWAATYRFRAPVRLERGSEIEVRSSDGNCRAQLDFVRTRNSPERREAGIR